MEEMANYQWYSITHQRKDLTRTRKPPGLFPEVEPEVVSEGEQGSKGEEIGQPRVQKGTISTNQIV